MRLPRFFLKAPLSVNNSILLPREITHHAKNVLRLEENNNIILFNGSDGEYEATILFKQEKAYAKILLFNPKEAELPGSINLIQSLTTNNKMDFIIEKAVELGVKNILPLKTHRSIVQLKEDRLEKRINHWNKIARSASEQCGRNKIVNIQQPITFESYLKSIPRHTHLFCHPQNNQALTKTIKENYHMKEVSIMIGPEGGWTENECALAKTMNNIYLVNFGNRILRTETAGIAIVSVITSLLGWND